jgi:two-component system cell cycle sensor histidine kinase/response regulator CckA
MPPVPPMPPVPRILLVDDEVTVREVMVRSLIAAGYHVVAVADGEGAWQTVQNEDFDLVVVDTVMPGMSGPSLVQRLRERQPGLPIIHISGSMDEAAARKAYPPDVPTMPKPFHMELLLQVIRDLLPERFSKPLP